MSALQEQRTKLEGEINLLKEAVRSVSKDMLGLAYTRCKPMILTAQIDAT